MKTRFLNLSSCLLALAIAVGTAFGQLAADQLSLDPRLEPLRHLLGKTYRGEFANSTTNQPVVDVVRWERALNGKAVRAVHSINDGAYGGESIVMWDEKKQAVGYHYFTTAGFYTTGTMTFQDSKILTHEVVTGSAGGVTEVRGTSEVRPDGTLHVKTEHLKEGQWRPGREANYREDSMAKVIFR